MDSIPDPSVGEECLQADLDTGVGEDARNLNLQEVVATTWKVHWLGEILSTISGVPGYYENPVTQKISSHV
jgi:hypothetical protein